MTTGRVLALAIAPLLASCAAGGSGRADRKALTPTEALLEYYAYSCAEYRKDMGRWPANTAELYAKPAGAFWWKGPYLDGAPPPLDEWKRPVAIDVRGERIDLRSPGADGVAGNADDVVVTR